MPNKNYVKGRRKEYRIMNNLKASGFDIVHRTAGSHSPIDVFAISKKAKIIWLVQSKPDSMLVSNKNKIMEEFDWLNDEFIVKFVVL